MLVVTQDLVESTHAQAMQDLIKRRSASLSAESLGNSISDGDGGSGSGSGGRERSLSFSHGRGGGGGSDDEAEGGVLTSVSLDTVERLRAELARRLAVLYPIDDNATAAGEASGSEVGMYGESTAAGSFGSGLSLSGRSRDAHGGGKDKSNSNGINTNGGKSGRGRASSLLNKKRKSLSFFRRTQSPDVNAMPTPTSPPSPLDLASTKPPPSPPSPATDALVHQGTSNGDVSIGDSSNSRSNSSNSSSNRENKFTPIQAHSSSSSGREGIELMSSIGQEEGGMSEAVKLERARNVNLRKSLKMLEMPVVPKRLKPYAAMATAEFAQVRLLDTMPLMQWSTVVMLDHGEMSLVGSAHLLESDRQELKDW
jgi:hypothetical protein